uniref:Xylulose kinase n=1 Tax=Strigamia maritima TaxID=126957 RepID=T1J0E2_STRMM
MATCQRGFYIGFDISTQSLKATVIDNACKVVAEVAVLYDSDLPEFRTRGGVHVDDLVVSSPPTMWVKAVDLVLEKLRASSQFDFSHVISLSGAAQQHGSVYWKKGAREKLKLLQSDKFLFEQAQKLAHQTGSVAYERFTASQIMKIYETQPLAYANTERISLISSFIASLFLGDFAPIDYSDGSGMNLMNIWEKEWIDELVQVVAPDLKRRLGELVPSYKNLGTISPYFVERYGFSKHCSVVTFTGDNSATVACAMLQPGDLVISLGTSDTLMFVTNSPVPTTEGHVICSPIHVDSFYVMLCFQNGSFVRERISNECTEGSWQLFSIYFDTQEILPQISGVFRFNKQNQKVNSFSKEVEVRALIEGQVLSKRVHAKRLGFKLEKGSKILATGGSSKNDDILQVFADAFDTPVYRLYENSASLGAALIAKYGCVAEPHLSFHDSIKLNNHTCAVTPSPEAVKVYDQMNERYESLEEKIIKEMK